MWYLNNVYIRDTISERMPNLSELMSNAARRVPGSEIRQLLSQAGKVKVSMGGGYPNIESFPVEDIFLSTLELVWKLRSRFPHVLHPIWCD